MTQRGLIWLVLATHGCGDSLRVSPDARAGDAPADATSDAEPDAVPSCVASGALDTSFGSAGVTILFGLTADVAAGLNDVEIDASSRIIVAGSFLTGARSCVLARVLPDGQLDGAFGAGGIVRQSFGERECWYTEVALQSDGKIVAVGAIDGLSSPRGIIARYLADGTLDVGFGQDGLVVAPAPPAASTYFSAVALDAEQRIVVAGTFTEGPVFEEVYTYLTRRYLADGSLDPSFNVDGTAEEPFRNGNDAAWDLTIQSNGRIVVVGTATTSPMANQSQLALPSQDVAVARS